MSESIIINGQELFLGLNVPPVRTTRFRSFAAAVGVLPKDVILAILADPGRMPGRVLCPYATWGKNQGGRGACNGFGAAASLERSIVKRGGARVRLSGEYVYANINGGQDQGSMLDDGMEQLLKGTCREELVPHEEYLLNRISQVAKDDAKRFKAFECYGVSTELELAAGLALGYVGVIAVHVGGGYMQVDSRGIRGASAGPGNHAVCCQDVVYDQGEFLFDEVGSWNNGYAYLTWQRHLKYTVQNHYFYLIRSTIDDPQGDNPPEVIA